MTREMLQELKELGEMKVNGVSYKYRAFYGWGEVRKRVGNFWGLVAKYNDSTGEWTIMV